MSEVDGRLEHWPIQEEYIRRAVGADWRPGHCRPAGNFEEASLAMMPRPVYEKFVKGYTAKQWGVAAATRSRPTLAGRFDVRRDGDIRLKTSRHQGIPRGGYGRLMRRMLDGIRVLTGVDYLQQRDRFTGAARHLLHRTDRRVFRVRPGPARLSRPAPRAIATCPIRRGTSRSRR